MKRYTATIIKYYEYETYADNFKEAEEKILEEFKSDMPPGEADYNDIDIQEWSEK